jgi:hypothetical protein
MLMRSGALCDQGYLEIFYGSVSFDSADTIANLRETRTVMLSNQRALPLVPTDEALVWQEPGIAQHSSELTRGMHY